MVKFIQYPNTALSVVFRLIKIDRVSDNNMLVKSYIEGFEHDKHAGNLRKFANSINNHPWITSIVISLPSIFLAALPFISNYFKLQNEGNTLNNLGIKIVWILLILSFLIILVRALLDNYDTRIKENCINVLRELNYLSSNTRNSKINRYKTIIDDKRDISFCEEIKPKEHLENVLNEASNVISKIVGIGENQIGILLLYKFSDQNDFLNITSKNSSDILNKSIYLEADNILPVEIREQSSPVYYDHNDKIEFIKNGISSLFCQNISINNRISLYLFVYTTDYILYPKKDKNSGNKFSSLIIPILINQVKLEMLKMYIDYIDKCPWQKSKRKKEKI